MKVIVTDHMAETKICPHCKTTTQACFPGGVTKAVQYGMNLKGVAVYLMQHQLLPLLRTVEVIYDLFNIHVAEGTLFKWLNVMYETIEKPVEAIKAFLIEVEVLHGDETGINCNTPKDFWLHIACTPDAIEAISYQMPTFKLEGNLVHFAAYANHIGFYPTPSGIEKFKKKLTPYVWAKGSVQFSLDKPIPYDLIRAIVVFRVRQNLGKAKKLGSRFHHSIENHQGENHVNTRFRSIRSYHDVYFAHR